MAYIGNEPVIGQWRKLDDISGSFNGSLTSFTTQVGGTNVTAGSANQLLVSLGGVLQEPGTDYSVSSSTITFTTAPAASLSFFAVLAGDALNTSVPADGSITTAKLGANLTVDLGLGSAGTPSLTFDADTGLFSGGDGQVNVATNGVERVEFGTSEVVFNDGGNDIDFRIESDTNANLFFVDAGNDRVGIGVSSPSTELHVSKAGSAEIRVSGTANGSDATIGIYGTPSGGGSRDISLKYDNVSDTYKLITTTGNDITISNSAGEAMRIDGSRRLLVGTTTTSSNNLLVVAGTTGGNPGFVQLQTEATTPGTTDQIGGFNFGTSADVSAARIITYRDSGTWTPGSSTPTALTFSTTADGASSPTERMRIQGNAQIVSFGNLVRLMPQTDNSIAMGGPSNRWTAVFAVNGSIQTSDERQKTEITDSALGAEFVKSLRPVSYKWIEGGKRHTGEYDEDNNYIYESVPGQRTHWGFIAQEVKQSVDDAGVDFGGWVLTDKDDPDSEQALRYDQFIAPLTKALQEALAKIETLEARLTAAGI